MLRYVFLAVLFVTMTSCASTLVNVFNKKIDPSHADAAPITHEIWDDLLSAHVSPEGFVDYAGLADNRAEFDKYIELLETHHPNKKRWTREESMAYWINAYNAFTVQLILDNYPVGSIKDIKGGITFVNSVWDQKFITIQGKDYDLNNIEQGILRKYYKEARIHFAVNCASISCPPLANFAFTAEALDEQLDLMATAFLADQSKNVITADELQLSKIFGWYKKDFTDDKNLQEYINQYTPIDVDPKAKIKYLSYDWGLNDISKDQKEMMSTKVISTVKR